MKEFWCKDNEWWRERGMKGLIGFIEGGMLATDVDSRVTSEAVLRILTSKV
ncbi:hypothetical protein IMZ48_11155 [Candidatus Bathyarchaeota archaeon]|nr:hypothetical protein [Candidatus Bathyarchaeota archaeon]